MLSFFFRYRVTLLCFISFTAVESDGFAVLEYHHSQLVVAVVRAYIEDYIEKKIR